MARQRVSHRYDTYESIWGSSPEGSFKKVLKSQIIWLSTSSAAVKELKGYQPNAIGALSYRRMKET
jgi:hypothetical protein